MSIISQETWDNMSNKEKEKLRSDYDDLVYLSEHGTDEFIKTESLKTIKEYERLFGKENLQPKPNIKTWKDLEKEHLEYFKSHNTPSPMFISSQELRDKLLNKSIATYKIATLIELGYGGIITDEEWEERINEGTGFYTIVYSPLYKSFHKRVESCNKQFIAFHTSKQAEEFMSYPENVKLLEQYNMI